jgi:hypothetical protein
VDYGEFALKIQAYTQYLLMLVFLDVECVVDLLKFGSD